MSNGAPQITQYVPDSIACRASLFQPSSSAADDEKKVPIVVSNVRSPLDLGEGPQHVFCPTKGRVGRRAAPHRGRDAAASMHLDLDMITVEDHR
jgi:hypothetical protein